ncbi:MAG: hypothetical protein ABT15_02595 [Pseudonocardia sp. SCN 73-27]|nr:MAG: hypothetical protein ABS80_00150 [Pseudonocardia sp. SCN 72-51]ODV08717.1 MAG: hypothetical protein ABT15_02595 [Pseudonocardia sp. SCN 73-27]
MVCALTLADADIGYGQMTVLRGVGITVRPGECLGVLGPNGAGKTTLLSCMAGVLGPRERVRHGCRCGRVTRRPHQGRA